MFIRRGIFFMYLGCGALIWKGLKFQTRIQDLEVSHIVGFVKITTCLHLVYPLCFQVWVSQVPNQDLWQKRLSYFVIHPFSMQFWEYVSSDRTEMKAKFHLKEDKAGEKMLYQELDWIARKWVTIFDNYMHLDVNRVPWINWMDSTVCYWFVVPLFSKCTWGLKEIFFIIDALRESYDRMKCIHFGMERFSIMSYLTKHSIPNYQKTSIVLVNTVSIPSMMDSVMTGCVQNPLKRSKFSHHLEWRSCNS